MHQVLKLLYASYRVCKSLGMVTPTQVQRGCIPAILAGRDVLGTAHTGSGKTAAFALPILQSLAKEPFGVYALVLTPTRSEIFLPWCFLAFERICGCVVELRLNISITSTAL